MIEELSYSFSNSSSVFLLVCYIYNAVGSFMFELFSVKTASIMQF